MNELDPPGVDVYRNSTQYTWIHSCLFPQCPPLTHPPNKPLKTDRRLFQTAFDEFGHLVTIRSPRFVAKYSHWTVILNAVKLWKLTVDQPKLWIGNGGNSWCCFRTLEWAFPNQFLRVDLFYLQRIFFSFSKLMLALFATLPAFTPNVFVWLPRISRFKEVLHNCEADIAFTKAFFVFALHLVGPVYFGAIFQ